MVGASDPPVLPVQRTYAQSDGASQANLVAFWLLGLINNSAYVIMLAGANDISSGSVGVVYLCAILPALCLKLSAPHWFGYVSYELRIWAVGVLMSAAYVTVALTHSRTWQLLGVALSSAQGGLGEASCLAMCGLYEPRRALTLWSSGTGFAGVFGYAWVTILHVWLGMSFSHTLLAANASSIAWLWVFYGLLERPQVGGYKQVAETASAPDGVAAAAAASPASLPAAERRLGQDVHERGSGVSQQESLPQQAQQLSPSSSCEDPSDDAHKAQGKVMTLRRRLRLTASLWPYMVPLTTVYAAEYSMQSGTWTAIGFPVQDAISRHHFYVYSNWCYQVGVFVSRSSGMLWQADRKAFWLMPALQCLMLAFFSVVAISHWPLYSMALLIPAVFVGCLGGAVYVNAFTLISKEVDPSHREFALAAASLGDSAGIAVADVAAGPLSETAGIKVANLAGVLIQGCMFKLNGIPGADFKCGA